MPDSTPKSPPPVFSRVPAFWQVQAVGWLGFATISLPLKQLAYASLQSSLLITAYQLPLALILTGLMRSFYLRVRPEQRSFWSAVVLVVGTCATAAALDQLISLPLNHWIGVPPQANVNGPAIFAFRTTLYLAWSLAYFLIKTQLAARQQAFHAAVADEKLRLESLRYQLNPRFLASSLAAIADEVEADPVVAKAMILRLTNFYRTALQQSERHDATTVRDELELIRAYLALESLRLGDALKVSYQVDDRLLELPLPPLLLLPLAEQAVQQGRQNLPKAFAIKVTAQRAADGQLLIELAHTGRLHGTTEPGGLPDTDLLNLRARFERHYPGRYQFVMTQDSTRVRATLTLAATVEHTP